MYNLMFELKTKAKKWGNSVGIILPKDMKIRPGQEITIFVGPKKRTTVKDLYGTLELGISVQKLMELQAGNILELNIRPEEGVSLVINGRCVGKGELHRLGNTLGVRILELG